MTSKTSTAGAVPVSDGTNFQVSKIASFFPYLTNAKYVRIAGNNLPIGDSDLYTVPQGRKCMILGGVSSFIFAVTVYNPSAGTITWASQIKVNGTYYRTKSSSSLSTLTGLTGTGFFTTSMVMNAGESVSINTTTTAGLNVWAVGIEFDEENTNIVTGRVLNLISGNNTIYTVPPGKTAASVGVIFSFGNTFSISNQSGGTLSYAIYTVNKGDSPGTTNQSSAAPSFVTGLVTGAGVVTNLTEGDSLVVNTSGGGAGQMAWTTVFEI